MAFASRFPTRLTAAGALLISLVVVGCAPSDGLKLHPVKGTVSYDGKPVDTGSITFRMDGPAGRSYYAPIKDGAYSVQVEAGSAHVSLTASRPIPGKFDTSNGTPEPIGEMYLPAKYSSASKLTADIKAGENEIPFDLAK